MKQTSFRKVKLLSFRTWEVTKERFYFGKQNRVYIRLLTNLTGEITA